MVDSTVGISQVAAELGVCVGLVYDPHAPTPAEAWVATVGLDASAAAADPISAVNLALAEYDAAEPEPEACAPTTKIEQVNYPWGWTSRTVTVG